MSTNLATNYEQTDEPHQLVVNPTDGEVVAFLLAAPLEEMPHQVRADHEAELLVWAGEFELGGEG